MSATADPLDVLLEETDPVLRALAHVELGRQAMVAGRRDRAVRHFREALQLDSGSSSAREALLTLGELSDPGLRRRRDGVFSRLFRKN